MYIFNLPISVTLLLIVILVAESALPPKSRESFKQEKSPVRLDDVLRNTLGASGFGGLWIPGSNDTLRVISGSDVWEYNVAQKSNRTVVERTVFEERFGNQGLGLSFSADNEYILVEHSRRSLWRHSYLAKYDIYHISSGDFTILQPKGFETKPQEELQLVKWSPTLHSLVFIYMNNIYYKSSHGQSDTSEQITSDGNDAVFNGISDWVYEEEMFGSPVALWFSTDSSNLAFVKFNDSQVEFYQWPLYGEPGVRETAYPAYEPLRYPKAGRDNPVVSLHIVKLNNPTSHTQIVYPVDQDKSLQYYIAAVTFATPNNLILQTMNRHQSQSVWNYCNCQDSRCVEIYNYSQKNGWIDAHTPTISSNGSIFLTIQPVAQGSGATGKSYNHIVAVSTSNRNNHVRTVSSGEFNVDSILGWDEANNKIYFVGSGMHANASERHVYSVNAEGANSSPVCISCALKTEENENCRSHSFSFSANYQLYQHSCRGPGVPEITTKWRSNDSVAHIWMTNSALRERLETKLLPTTKDVEVDIADGLFKAKVRLYLPPNFDESKKYPLLIDVYAGPDSQKISEDFKVDWGTYLASSQGIIYGSIDARGSGRQSTDLKFAVYRNLGSVEVEDQIFVTKHLVNTLSYIDANKTAIWGWSYGGYVTAMVLGKDYENIFKCGVSVAPVSSWLYYDTIYTERYMGLPTDDDNWLGYNSSSVMNNLGNIKTKQFLLIHGNADDNVHYQHSMMLARAMEQADIMFNQLSYPEENHGINGPGMRRHLYHSIEKFLNSRECFGNRSPDSKSHGSTFRLDSFSLLFTSVSVIFSCYKKL